MKSVKMQVAERCGAYRQALRGERVAKTDRTTKLYAVLAETDKLLEVINN